MRNICIEGCPHYVGCEYHDPNECGKVVQCLCNGTGKECIGNMIDIDIDPDDCCYNHGCPDECKYNATCLHCNGVGWWFVEIAENGEVRE